MGIEDFSGFEVIRAAMEVEKSGHLFYSTMAKKARSEMAREIFSWLAQDEVSHLHTLENLAPKYRQEGFWEDEAAFLPYLRRFRDRDIFPSADLLEKVLRGDDPDVRALDLAIEAEERFADYFHKAAAAARTAEGREAFSWLAAEEDRHAAILKERRAKMTNTGA